MTIYENGNDREQQAIAGFQLERHLRKLGVSPIQIIHTPESRRASHDMEMWVHGKWTTVIEVKCRKIHSDTYDSIVIDRQRLRSLAKKFGYKEEVSGKFKWSKEVIFLFRCTEDDVCYAVHVEDIQSKWDELEDAPQEALKDDHGKKQSKHAGKLIPVAMMERFQ